MPEVAWSELGRRLRRHVAARGGLFLATTLMFLFGLAFGVAAVAVLSPLERADLLQYVGGFLAAVKGGAVAGPHLMRQALWRNVEALAVAWLVGASVAGLPVVCLILVLRGFAVGFTVAFLGGELGARGWWLTALGVVPGNVLVVPAFVLVAAAAWELAVTVVRQRRRSRLVWRAYGTYLAEGAACLVLLLVGSAVEAYLSPLLIGALWPYLVGG